MKFRILHTEASLAWGGQEIRILREAIGLRMRGHELTIAANPHSILLEKARLEGFRTIPFEFKRRNFLAIIAFFKRLIEEEKLDIINTHSSKDSWLVLPAARLAKNKPLAIRTRHLSTPIGKNILSTFLYNNLPHVVITTGEAIRAQMIRENGFNSDKIISIPTGVDTDVFNPVIPGKDLREELNLSPSTLLVGTVSVIRDWKGHDYLLKAVPLILREVSNARFIIAGDGPDIKKLEKTIKDAGLNDKIYMLGHREDIVSILKSIDILVHPSYANEGVPQAILQAMSMAKPVVASELAPLKEVVIDGETGVLCPVRHPEGIANATIKLLADKAFSKSLGENGRKLVEKSYSYTGMLDRLEDLYIKRQLS